MANWKAVERAVCKDWIIQRNGKMVGTPQPTVEEALVLLCKLQKEEDRTARGAEATTNPKD